MHFYTGYKILLRKITVHFLSICILLRRQLVFVQGSPRDQMVFLFNGRSLKRILTLTPNPNPFRAR